MAQFDYIGVCVYVYDDLQKTIVAIYGGMLIIAAVKCAPLVHDPRMQVCAVVSVLCAMKLRSSSAVLGLST